MNTTKIDNASVPPIVKDYILNVLNNNVPIHIRNNYRDLLFNIRHVCDEAIVQFDKELKKSSMPTRFNKKKIR